MNELEKLIFAGDGRWFLLEALNYDENNKTLEIIVFPHDEEVSRRGFVFNGVNDFTFECEAISDYSCFPKQILGIDWFKKKSYY